MLPFLVTLVSRWCLRLTPTLSPETGAREPSRAILKHEGGPSSQGSGRTDVRVNGYSPGRDASLGRGGTSASA